MTHPRLLRSALSLLALLALLAAVPAVHGGELPEYRLKAAVLYNFALFTEWPVEVGSSLNLCVHGADPFGAELDELHGKRVGARSIAVRRMPDPEANGGCQILFVAASAVGGLPQLLEGLRGLPVLTVADSPGAARQGVALNMVMRQSRIAFEVNLKAARAARLTLSSKLLRLATEVYQ